MKTKEELQQEIYIEISKIRGIIKDSLPNQNDATNRVALSNLYIALSNLIK